MEVLTTQKLGSGSKSLIKLFLIVILNLHFFVIHGIEQFLYIIIINRQEIAIKIEGIYLLK